jgi:hypothetical protein
MKPATRALEFFSKCLLLRNGSLTADIEREIKCEMKAHYRSVWWLDDTFSRSQGASTNNNNQAPRMFPTQIKNTEHPIAPWGFVVAWASLALAAGAILIMTATGGLNLG